MFTNQHLWRFPSSFARPSLVCCLQTFSCGLKRFVKSVWILGAVQLLVLVLELMEQTGDKILSPGLFVFFYTATLSESMLCLCVHCWTMMSSLFSIWTEKQPCSSFVAVVLWALLFLYLFPPWSASLCSEDDFVTLPAPLVRPKRPDSSLPVSLLPYLLCSTWRAVNDSSAVGPSSLLDSDLDWLWAKCRAWKYSSVVGGFGFLLFFFLRFF